jgi:hypothetical protein
MELSGGYEFWWSGRKRAIVGRPTVIRWGGCGVGRDEERFVSSASDTCRDVGTHRDHTEILMAEEESGLGLAGK